MSFYYMGTNRSLDPSTFGQEKLPHFSPQNSWLQKKQGTLGGIASNRSNYGLGLLDNSQSLRSFAPFQKRASISTKDLAWIYAPLSNSHHRLICHEPWASRVGYVDQRFFPKWIWCQDMPLADSSVSSKILLAPFVSSFSVILIGIHMPHPGSFRQRTRVSLKWRKHTRFADMADTI